MNKDEEKKQHKPFHALKSFMSFFHGTDLSWSPEVKTTISVLHSLIALKENRLRTWTNVTFDLKQSVSVLGAHKPEVVPPQKLKNHPVRQQWRQVIICDSAAEMLFALKTVLTYFSFISLTAETAPEQTVDSWTQIFSLVIIVQYPL